MIFQQKTCSRCHVSYPATPEHFHSDKRVKSGLKAECKACANNRLNAFREQHPDAIKQYTQNYAVLRRDELTKRSAEWTRNNKDKKKAQAARFNQKYPEKRKAVESVNYAIKTGKLSPAKEHACIHNGERCRGRAVAYHHHNGYDKEHVLDVIPVCGVCHAFLNKETNRAVL